LATKSQGHVELLKPAVRSTLVEQGEPAQRFSLLGHKQPILLQGTTEEGLGHRRRRIG
jgi:hypothetical protein